MFTKWKEEAKSWENACKFTSDSLDKYILKTKELEKKNAELQTRINFLEVDLVSLKDRVIAADNSAAGLVSQLDNERNTNNALRNLNAHIKQSCKDNYADQYQLAAARTIGCNNHFDASQHALFGLAGEVGELLSIYQKTYQGHTFDPEHTMKEVGDILWMIAEYCTANDWKLSEVMDLNIQKLLLRYPDGFEAEKSLNRADGDI